MPNQWAFFGGEIKDGETPEEAVKREGFEELNYKLKAPLLILEQKFQEGKVNGYMYVYIEYFPGAKSALILQEGQDWGWFKESETVALGLIERDKRIISALTSYLDKNTVLTG